MLSPPDRGDTGILAHLVLACAVACRASQVPCMPLSMVHLAAHDGLGTVGVRRQHVGRVGRRRTGAFGLAHWHSAGRNWTETMCTDARIASGQRVMLPIEGRGEGSRAARAESCHTARWTTQVLGVCRSRGLSLHAGAGVDFVFRKATNGNQTLKVAVCAIADPLVLSSHHDRSWYLHSGPATRPPSVPAARTQRHRHRVPCPY